MHQKKARKRHQDLSKEEKNKKVIWLGTIQKSSS